MDDQIKLLKRIIKINKLGIKIFLAYYKRYKQIKIRGQSY